MEQIEQTKKPPLWARIIGSIVVGVLDNLFLIVAIALLANSKPIEAAFAVVMAFYSRITDIRDAVQNCHVEVTLTKGN